MGLSSNDIVGNDLYDYGNVEVTKTMMKRKKPVSKTGLFQHSCKKEDYCTCYPLALEPSDTCELHGSGNFPKQCVICGRFLSLVMKEADDAE